MRKYLLWIPFLILFSSFTGGSGNDGNYHLVGNSKDKFMEAFNEGMDSGYFFYEELAAKLLPKFKELPYGSGGGTCPAEKTMVNFTSFDCVTFVESFWSLCSTVYLFQSGRVAPGTDPLEVFAKNLNRIRYFGGQNCGIEDRIHYFTQQMIELERSGVAFNVALANGDVFTKKINFVSSNSEKYGDFAVEDRHESVEKVLNSNANYFYSLKHIEHYYPLAKTGDIVSFASEEPGLDVSHTGIIVVEEGEVKFTHASSLYNKVVHGQDLTRYLNSRTTCSGIFVFRPVYGKH